MLAENSQFRAAVPVCESSQYIFDRYTDTKKQTNEPLQRLRKQVHYGGNKTQYQAGQAAKKPPREAPPAKSRESLAFCGENSALSTSLQRHGEKLGCVLVYRLTKIA